jgi:hypothetical protein
LEWKKELAKEKGSDKKVSNGGATASQKISKSSQPWLNPFSLTNFKKFKNPLENFPNKKNPYKKNQQINNL